MSVTIAREVAYDSFITIMEHRGKPEDVLDAAFEGEPSLNRLDRNFIRELVYGSLRWHKKLYWILQNTSKRDLAKATEQIRAALVLGTYQIYYMDRVPDRAAVNESVEYVRKKGQSHACSFVNGILRQIARRAEYFTKPNKTTHQLDYLALQYAHPEWMVNRWQQQFKFEKLEALLAANNQVPPHSIRLNLMKHNTADIKSLQERLLKEEKTHSERRPLRTALRLKEAPNLGPGSLFASGEYTIQDEASQLIGFCVDPSPGEVIVDACAGPGGKLSHLYELGKEEIKLIAVEKGERSMARAKQTMARLGHEKLSWIADDFSNWVATEPVDKILLDAPCSGLGVLRRHPEGKWHKNPSIVGNMATIQRGLIKHAMEQLKLGGELIYSVCSFEPEESKAHLDWLQETASECWQVVSPVSKLPDYYKKFVTRDNILLIYSGNNDDMDGFACFIVKKLVET